ncbi:MAG: tryptophan-rich sensory protein [Ruminococcaceae bacterium]|nr:tryptophan-rich sensory protein [Oscillospiraceae bacterium]
MSTWKQGKNRFLSRIRGELCRICLRCVIIGAVIVLVVGVLSALAAGPTSAFYELKKPLGTPPALVFPIAWTILYVLIGGAAGAVACIGDRAAESDKYKGLLFFIIQMIFNFIWSPLFFGAGAYFAAFCAIVMMIILTIFTIFAFWRVLRLAGAAMIVYLLWLFFAAYLNLGIIVLN